MTETEKNALKVRVAKLRGWKIEYQIAMGERVYDPNGVFIAYGNDISKYCPDYPNDLNACAELLDRLRDNGWLVILERKPVAYPRGGPWHVWLRHGNDGGHSVLSESDENLAVAICLAFVATMEEKQ